MSWSLLRGRITETLAVTRGEGGFNVAPMGVIREGEAEGGPCSGNVGGEGYERGEDGEGGEGGERGDVEGGDEPRVYARLWEGSDTLDNVRDTERVVVNFTRDPLVYVEGALGAADDRVVDDRLEGADAWIRCTASLDGVERGGDVERWRLERRETEVRERTVFAVNRGFNALIEASVDATRLDLRPGLRERVDRNLELARKCGGSRERRAADTMERLLE